MSARLKRAIERLKAARAGLRDAAQAIEELQEDATEAEVTAAEEEFNTAEAEVEAANVEHAKAKRISDARSAGPEDVDVRVTREPFLYRRDKPELSYLLDLARSTIRSDRPAQQRLDRHAQEMRTEVERVERASARGLDVALEGMLAGLPDQVAQVVRQNVSLRETRGVNRIEGFGGEFIPPAYLLSDYAEVARSGRPFANWVRSMPLPANTDQLRIPRITQGGKIAGTPDGTQVPEQAMRTAMVDAPVRTRSGQHRVPMQMLDQSPMAWDEIIFPDLLGELATDIETQVLYGSGAGEDLLGILNTPGITTTAYTDATPTFPELWPKLWSSINNVETNRKRVVEGMWFAGRRYNWAAAQLDGQQRPFIIPMGLQPMNALGITDVGFEGPIANIGGYIGYKTLSMPTNLGGGLNEDRIITTRASDHLLLEGQPNVRALQETRGETLEVVFQVWEYVAYTGGRYPPATDVVSGTGLATPVF